MSAYILDPKKDVIREYVTGMGLNNFVWNTFEEQMASRN
jgi:hypothetical protein